MNHYNLIYIFNVTKKYSHQNIDILNEIYIF